MKNNEIGYSEKQDKELEYKNKKLQEKVSETEKENIEYLKKYILLSLEKFSMQSHLSEIYGKILYALGLILALAGYPLIAVKYKEIILPLSLFAIGYCIVLYPISRRLFFFYFYVKFILTLRRDGKKYGPMSEEEPVIAKFIEKLKQVSTHNEKLALLLIRVHFCRM